MKSVKIKLALCAALILFINVVESRYVLSGVLAAAFLASIYCLYKGLMGYKSLIMIFLLSTGFSMLQAVSVGQTILYRVHFFGFAINIYWEGLYRASFTFLRVSGSMLVLAVVISTVKISQLILLLRESPLPKAFEEIVIMALKFIFIFKEDIGTVRKAQKARLGYTGIYSSARSSGTAAGNVLVRAIDRSEVLAKSMKSRGCSGNFAGEPKEYR